jgi:hypothetical protein
MHVDLSEHSEMYVVFVVEVYILLVILCERRSPNRLHISFVASQPSKSFFVEITYGP